MTSERKLHGWGNAAEENLISLAKEVNTYGYLHKQSSIILSGKMEKSTLWAAILSAGTSASSGGILIAQLSEDNEWISIGVNICVSIISFITTILIIYQKNKNFLPKIQGHKDAEARYIELGLLIQAQIQLPVSQREHGRDFFSWVARCMNGISSLEDLESEAITLYLEKYPDEKIAGLNSIREVLVDESSDTVNENNDARPNGAIKHTSESESEKFKTRMAERRNMYNVLSPTVYARGSPMRRFIDDEKSKIDEIELMRLNERIRRRSSEPVEYSESSGLNSAEENV